MSDPYLFRRLQVLKAGVTQTIDDTLQRGAELPPQVLSKLTDTEANLDKALELLDQAAANRECNHPSLRSIGGRLQCRRCQVFLASEELRVS